MSILIGKKEASEMLGVAPVTIDRLRMAGMLPYRKIGSLVKFTVEDVTKCIENIAVRNDQNAARA